MAIVASDTLEEGENVPGSRFFQYFAAISATFGIICTEMHYGWPSPSSPQLRNGTYYFTISSEVDSWLAVTPLLGAIVGAVCAGFLVDVLGRKRLIVTSSIPLMISWILVGVATSPTLMFVGRFMAGVFDGVSFTAVPMYLGEIAEPQIRGLIASVCPVSIIFGILLINAIGSYLPIDTTAYIAVICPALLLMTFIKMPESPYFLLMKGRHKEAIKSLQKFRGTSNVSKELDRMLNAVKEQNSQEKGKFLDLVTVLANRRACLIAFGLRGFQQLSGTTAIIFYCNTIFKESEHFLSANIATIIYFSIQLFLSCLSSLIVDFSGRRPLLIASNIGTILCLFLNGFYLYFKNCTDLDVASFSFLPLVALLCFVIVFSIGWQTIPLLIMGELFPTNVKGFALSCLDIYYSVLVTIISKYFHWSNEELGLHVPFFTFGVCCVIGLVFIIIFVPETKNKTLEDIQDELKSGQFGWFARTKY